MTDVILDTLKGIMDDAGFFVHRYVPFDSNTEVLEALSLSYTLRVALDEKRSCIVFYYGAHWNEISTSDPEMYQKASELLGSLGR